jgi:hypothetical protein
MSEGPAGAIRDGDRNNRAGARRDADASSRSAARRENGEVLGGAAPAAPESEDVEGGSPTDPGRSLRVTEELVEVHPPLFADVATMDDEHAEAERVKRLGGTRRRESRCQVADVPGER